MPFRFIVLACSFFVLASALPDVSQNANFDTALFTQAQAAPGETDLATKLNGNTISIVSGNPNGTYLAVAYDISAVLDDGDNLRVLPIIGKGAAQNIRDILYLKGVDMGITQSSFLRYFAKTGEAGKGIEQRLRYVAPLFNEELHVLVRPGINRLDDLKGKKINFSDAGSGTQLSCKLLFEDLGFIVQEVNFGQLDAIEKLKAGEIDATILVAGKPAGVYSKIIAGSGLKFIPIPFDRLMSKDYLPAELKHEDYPTVIPAGGVVETVAFSSVLAVFNWAPNTERYRRVELFTNAFFKNFDKFLAKPRHPKWQEVNLLAEVPGWTRFAAAQKLVDDERKGKSETNMQSAFARFLAEQAKSGQAPVSEEMRTQLFRQFLDWQKSKPGGG